MQEQQDFAHGIEWMDFQHRQLLDKFNELHDCSAPAGLGYCGTKMDETIAFLERYIDEHFALEEIYMKKTAYPDLKKHEREHLIFANDFRQLRQKIEQGATHPQKLVDQLATWIINHIANTDRVLAAYLLKKSIR
jgi:hemerythrin-like metal-binding protein